MYKKIWSDNPEKFKKVDANEALIGYMWYLLNYASRLDDLLEMKSFKEWLRTEI